MTSTGRGCFYGDTDLARIMYGENARHVPCWMYVQHQGEQDGQAIVGFVGASKVPGPAHPLRYGSGRSHQFLVGEMIARPRLVVGTDAFEGLGIGGLYINGHRLDEMLAQGELVIGAQALLAELDRTDRIRGSR